MLLENRTAFNTGYININSGAPAASVCLNVLRQLLIIARMFVLMNDVDREMFKSLSDEMKMEERRSELAYSSFT